MNIFADFEQRVRASVEAVLTALEKPVGDLSRVTVEPPRDASHGDLATNAAMVLAKPAGSNPRAIATALAAELERLPEVASVSVAGPGFINLTLVDDAWRDELGALVGAGTDYGRSTVGEGRSTLPTTAT